ncbi:virulence factor TspB C-terminal domain-related protein [Stenotrophomonas sp. 6O]|uniref:virulence factor TspB C-terminal domain-related protein n=1 Tax=Stenotrophomonas sp. 6O TaxID=3448170 RepID=UPI003EDED816
MVSGLRDHLCGFQLMHWLARVFASAIARRIAYVLVALVLAWAGIGTTKAATYRCTAIAANCTEPEAFAEANAYAKSVASPPYVACVWKGSGKSYVGAFGSEGCQGYRDGLQTFYYNGTCAEQPEYTGQGPWSNLGGSARSGSIGCRGGCDGIWNRNADSSSTWSPTGAVCPEDEKKNCESPAMANAGYYWNFALNVCEPPKPECAGGQNPNSLGQCAPEPCPDGMAQQADGTCKKKDSECPAGQVRSPDGKCLPGDGQCASGEVRGPDGTCKKDGDGDGKPDPVDEESFSGGDDCSSPPACSGSPIMCGQARIQWRIDCNTRKNRNISGGLCSAMPVCTGEKCDAMEYAGLLMQWRTACAVEKLAGGSSNGGDNADVKAIRDALTGTGGSVTTPADRPASDVWTPGSGQPTRPDASGYGWGRGCPQPPSIEVMGQTIAFDITPLCRWLGLGSYFVVGLAALFCLRIIASKDA